MTLAPVVSGRCADPVDYLLTLTGGTVLRVPDPGSSGGEYDPLTGGTVSARDRRRLAGARLISRTGDPADVLLHDVQCSAMCPAELVDANPDEFVTWYVATALQGLDDRAAHRAGDEWADYDDDPRYLDHLADEYGPGLEADDIPVTDTVPAAPVAWPTWCTEWHGRLLHEPKRVLLEQLAAARWAGAPAPMVPDADWARDVARKFARRAR